MLKRTADRHVAQESDICHASSFYTLVQSEIDKIPLFFVDETEFETSNIEISPGNASIPGTMKLYQWVTISRCSLSVRELSCCCETFGTFCKCYKTNQYILWENQTQHVQADSDCYCNTTSTAMEESQEMDLISGDIARICINDCRIDDWVVVLYDEKRYLGERKDISLHDAEFYVSVHVSRK